MWWRKTSSRITVVQRGRQFERLHFGTLRLADDGVWTYQVDDDDARVNALNAGESLSERFAILAHDGKTVSVINQIIVTINGVNDAPVAQDDGAAATENGAQITGNVLTNDSDPDDARLSVSHLRPANDDGDPTPMPQTGADLLAGGIFIGTYGRLTMTASGTYNYEADQADIVPAGATEQDIFTYTVTDGTHSATATLTIAVAGVNDAPVAANDRASVDEGAGSGACDHRRSGERECGPGQRPGRARVGDAEGGRRLDGGPGESRWRHRGGGGRVEGDWRRLWQADAEFGWRLQLCGGRPRQGTGDRYFHL